MQEVVVEGVVASLGRIREFIEERCAEAGLPQDAAFAVTLAVDEVCSNVVRHGYRGMDPGPIRVTFEPQPGAARVTVTDHGRTFPPHAAPTPNLSTDWRDRRIGGLGWYLVKQMVDELEYRTDPSAGNVLTLVKKFDGVPIDRRRLT